MASNTINVSSGDIFYRETGSEHNTRPNVLLLHGMRFSSETWQKLGTLDKLAEWNYRAIAIDLPGYGNSKATSLKSSEAYFVKEICEKLSISQPVVISPSMSGGYSLPFLFEYGEEMSGFIPVAPVSTEKFESRYSKVNVPTLIVYGDRDTDLGTTSLKHLSGIPNHKIVKIEDAGHACYLDKPEIWHSRLKEFLDEIAN